MLFKVNSILDNKRFSSIKRLHNLPAIKLIYLKLYLLSMNTDKVIFYEGSYNCFIRDIAKEINEDNLELECALHFLKNYGIIKFVEVRHNGTMISIKITFTD